MRHARRPPAEGWGARWARLVAEFGWTRGRHEPAPSGRVRELEIETSGISAKVRDGRDRVAEPHLALEPFPDEVRGKAVEALAKKASFVASLLAGRLPEDADEALAATGWTLLPSSPREVHQSCTCGEGPSPCRHLLALHEVLEERLSRDPFLLFTLRGVDRETLLAELRGRRGAGAAIGAPPRHRPVSAARATPLAEVPPDRFFRPLAPLASLLAPYAPATAPDAVLATLGPPPLEDPDAARLLSELHRAIGLGAKERLSEWEWRRS